MNKSTNMHCTSVLEGGPITEKRQDICRGALTASATKALVLAVAFSCGPFVSEASAQFELFTVSTAVEDSARSHRFGVFGVALMPMARLFYPDSETVENQIDPFPKNVGSLGIQLVGVDMGYFYGESPRRFGIGLSPHVGFIEHAGAGVVVVRLGFFVQGKLARIEFGRAIAVSNASELSREQRRREAWFVGISTPDVGQEVMKVLARRE